MKKVTLVMCVMVAVLLMASAAMAVEKIGFIDMQKVLNESEQGKKAKTALESFIKTQQAKIDEKEKAIDAMKADFDKKSSALSEDGKKKKQEEIQSLVRDLKRIAGEAQDEVRKKEQELTKDVFKDIKDIITGLGKEEGFTAILDVNVALYNNDSTDLTSKVIKKYNDLNGKKK